MKTTSPYRRGILLDRDGVLLVNRPDYIKSIEEVEFIAGVERAVASLWEQGYTICVVTNQAGVAKGLYSMSTVERIHQFMENYLRKQSRTIFQEIHWYVCPHREEDKCHCRKPKPGILVEAIKRHGFLACDTWMVGDSARDIVAGVLAGCRTALVRTGLGKAQVFPSGIYPQAVFPDLLKFVEKIIH